MPEPRSCSTPELRSKTSTSQPTRDSAIAAAQPAMLPPMTPTLAPLTCILALIYTLYNYLYCV